MMQPFGISAPAALAVSALQASGYVGPALLSDPCTGHLVLFLAEPWGCHCLGVAPIPHDDGAHDLVELPGLTIAPGVTPADAFRAADAELRRLNRHKVN